MLKRGKARASCDVCHKRRIKCDRTARVTQGYEQCSQCALRDIPCVQSDIHDIRLKKQLKARTPQNNTSAEHLKASHALPIVVPEASTSSSGEIFEGLSSESAAFLDQLFSGGISSFDENMKWDDMLMAPTENFMWSTPSLPSMNTTSSYVEDFLSHEQLLECLHAYFDMAAQCLPVIIEDAFWEDFNESRCSPRLVLAIAHRGIVFSNIPDKLSLQQQIANQFRILFIEKQQDVQSRKSFMHIDDLEALALMTNIAYTDQPTSSSDINQRLGRLFLTHESLVLLTLEAGIAENNSKEHYSSSLSRLHERQTLLFWHVYGVDSFYCLDHKVMSRIPEDEDDADNKSVLRGAGGYLDAILSLATIARKILKMLCSGQSRRKGINFEALSILYSDLHRWRYEVCLPHLEWSKDDNHDNVVKPIQKATLRLLELNCFMQIESCVQLYGIQEGQRGLLAEDKMSFYLEYNSLHAIEGIVEIADWSTGTPAPSPHSYSDLAPQIIRDICAGACLWICNRAPYLHTHAATAGEHYTVKRTSNLGLDDDRYLHIARILLRAVEASSSHPDTKSIVDNLDTCLRKLKTALSLQFSGDFAT